MTAKFDVNITPIDMKKLREWLVNLTASLLVCVLFLGAMEAGLRIVYRRQGLRSKTEAEYIKKNDLWWLEMLQVAKMSVTQRDKTLLWSNVPNRDQTVPTYQLKPQSSDGVYFAAMPWISNDEGYLGTKQSFRQHKQPGEVRVLVLGDSSGTGYGLLDPQQSFSMQLEKLLNQRKPHGERFQYRVMNASSIGYTSTQGLRYLQTYGEAAQPDLIVTYFGNNDGTLHGKLSDAQIFASQKDSGDTAAAVEGVRHYLDRFYLVRYLDTTLVKRFNKRNYNSNVMVEERQIRVSPDEYAENFKTMAEWARAHQIPMVMVQAPVNLAWPPRSAYADGRGGFIDTPRGRVRDYPGFGPPIVCSNPMACLYSLYGPWFTVKLPESKSAPQNDKLVRGDRSLWEIRDAENLGKVEDAEKLYAQWLSAAEAVEPWALAAAKNNLGVLLLERGEKTSGEKLVREAVALDPQSPYPAYNLGMYLLSEHRDLAQAKDLLRFAMDHDHEIVRLHSDYAAVLRKIAADTQAALVNIDAKVDDDLASHATEPTLFMDFCHPTQEGHRLIAEAIYNEISPPDSAFARHLISGSNPQLAGSN